MKGRIKRLMTGLQTILRCFSVAIRQAEESEIDNPSARRFRRLNGTGGAPSSPLQGETSGLREVMTRAGIALQTFRNCCAQANRQARQSEIDVPARRRFREMSVQGILNAGDSSVLGIYAATGRTGAVPDEADFLEKRLEEIRSAGAGGNLFVLDGKEGSFEDPGPSRKQGTEAELDLVS